MAVNDRAATERIRMKVNTGYSDTYYAGYNGYNTATGTTDTKSFSESIEKAGSGAVTGTGLDKAEENTSRSHESTSSTNIRDMSDKEWDKLMERVDNFIDDFKEAVEYEKEVSVANKEKSEETAKDIVEELSDRVTANREFTKQQELALTGSTQEGISSTDGVTECASAEDIGDVKTTWTITAFSEDGIVCTQFKDGEKTELWRMSYKHKGDYEKVTDFLNTFDKNADYKFASSKSFWEDFLDGKISDEELKKLY